MHVLSHGAPARREGAVVQQRARPQRRAPAGPASSSSPPARSSSTTTRAAARSAASRSRPTSARSRATRCRRSAAWSSVNRTVDKEFAEALVKQFCEVIFAPSFTEEALEILVRQAEHAHPRGQRAPPREHRRARHQARDGRPARAGPRRRPRGPHGDGGRHRAQPTEREWGEMLFAWKVCKHVRSNAIVLSKDLATVGIGAGQMSRVDSVRLAIEKARDGGHRPHRLGARVGRVLPVRRRPAARGRRGRDLHHPAGRLEARPRGRRGRRRGRHLDGVHPPQALQALTAVRSASPYSVRSQIVVIVSDDDSGSTGVAPEHGWSCSGRS